MQKLRRSRFLKFFSVFLILVLAVVIVANIVGSVFLMEENLFYASRTQAQQKAYSYIHNYVAGDLLGYLNLSEAMCSNDDNYVNYHKSEIELYKSKYSPEKSNIYFEISDEYGNLLLSNENRLKDGYFSFTSTYATDTEHLSQWFQNGNSDSGEYTVDVTELISEETTFIEEHEYASEDDVKSDSETTTLSENGNGIEDKIIDNTSYEIITTSVINTYSDNETEILYYYKNPLNNDILNYCKSMAEDIDFNISSVTFYQDDFTYDSENGLFLNNIYSDKNNNLKSFSTTLFFNGKTAEITYSYSGSILFNEFCDRLAYTSLILNSSSMENMTFLYNQRGRIQLEVKIMVPYTCHVNDIWKAAEISVDVAMAYMNNIIILTVIDICLFLISLIYLFWSAGYIPNKKGPVARGLHAIPFDMTLPVAILLCVCGIALMDTNDWLFFVFGALIIIVLLFFIVYTLTVRIRAHRLIKGCLTYKIYVLVKSAVSVVNETTGTMLKTIVICFIFILITSFEVLFFLISGNVVFSAILLFALRLFEIPVIVLLFIALIALHNGAKNISKGDVDYRIRNILLVGPLKKHADYLNSINDAVNNAVEERLKSESLKTELITNVSHDLKTPLTSIVNYVDLLKKENIENVKANEYIEVIDRQSQRLKKLTIDIVEASKAATGNIDVHFEMLNLNVILLQTNGEYIERLNENELSLISDIPDNNVFVSADGRLLWRVIDNLMSNICKYSMPGTRVYLDLRTNGSKAEISFRNISKGKLNISPEDLTERFVRGDTSRNTEGSGLGLSIAKSLTETMNGELNISIDGDLFKVIISFDRL